MDSNKKLIELYPFLLPRNVLTDEINEDYDYSYTLADCLPKGWEKMFLQMCKDIRQSLIEANFLDDFRFSQIKEKYGEMRCYHFGAPESVCDIIQEYEYISTFVCEKCGKPATKRSKGWVGSYCDDCMNNLFKYEPIEFDPIMKITRFSKEGSIPYEYDVSDIWNRLYEQ